MPLKFMFGWYLGVFSGAIIASLLWIAAIYEALIQ